MRRPSRQGLRSVCTFYHTVLIKAIPALNSKEKSLSSTEFLPIPSIVGITATQRPDRPWWSLNAYPAWLCLIMMTLQSYEKDPAKQPCGQPEISIEKAHQVFYQMTIPKLILFFLLASVLLTARAHGQDITQETQKYFGEIRRGNFPVTPGSLSHPENENTILYLMESYLHDTVYAVRAKAHEIAYLVASHSTNADIRNQGVGILIRACAEPALGMTAISLDFLKQFEKGDF